MIGKLSSIAHSKSWWWLLIVLGVSMIGIALYYQHVLNEWPCVLCIHVRMLFLLLVIVSSLALMLFRLTRLHVVMHFLVTIISAAILERSWQLLATERGWIEGECSVDLGIPSWMAMDKWLPDVFSAWTSCGYTPVIALGVTMAEVLLVLSVLLLLQSMVLFVSAANKPY